YERMHEAAQSLPFLASRKLIILRRPSANKEFVEQFEKFVADIPETNDVVVVEPKLDKRLLYHKLLKKVTRFQEFTVFDRVALERYLIDYVKEQGGSVGTDEVRLLIDRVGTSQLTLQNELNKL